MFRASVRFVMLLSAVASFCATPASATILYEDSFSRTGALNASTPDTTTGGAAWTASENWTTDGSRANLNALTSHAWLPFSPVSGGTYTLSVTIDCTGDAYVPSWPDDWMAFGFSDTAATSGQFHLANGVAAWMLAENDLYPPADRTQTFMGPGAAEGVGVAGLDIGAHQYSVVLDTTSPLWSVEFKVNGTTVRGPVAYTSNPTINWVGFGSNGGTGWVDNFQVSSAIPEPGTVVMLAAGLIGLLAYAWKKRP